MSSRPQCLLNGLATSDFEGEDTLPWCVDTIDPICGDEWDACAQVAFDATVFHSSAWARVLIRSYGHAPHYLRIRSGLRVLAIVPIMELDSRWTGRRGVCLPFSDGCGPLRMTQEDAETVYDALAAYARFHEWGHLEIRDGRLPPAVDVAESVYLSHDIDLKVGMSALWQGLAPSVRRAIRKAKGMSLEVTVESNESAFRIYHDLHSRTRRRHGLPPQPLGFFLNLHREVILPGNGAIILAKVGRDYVAGAVFLHNKRGAIYKFGASDERFWSCRPNQAVMWAGMTHLVTGTTCTTLNLGRTAVANSGLIRFKESFGASVRPLRYHRYRQGSAWRGEELPAIKKAYGLFRACPLMVNRLLGANIYPHLD